MDDPVEIIGRAIAKEEAVSYAKYREHVDETATIILAALSARGLAVVPVEPTPEMLAAPLHEQDACDAQYTSDEAFREAWTDMIAASPYQKGQ